MVLVSPSVELVLLSCRRMTKKKQCFWNNSSETKVVWMTTMLNNPWRKEKALANIINVNNFLQRSSFFTDFWGKRFCHFFSTLKKKCKFDLHARSTDNKGFPFFLHSPICLSPWCIGACLQARWWLLSYLHSFCDQWQCSLLFLKATFG